MFDLTARARRAAQDAGFDIQFSRDEQRELQGVLERTASTRSSDASDEIVDWRGLLWSSIDNDTSRDLDQVEFAELLPNGDILLRIGIADVDQFVAQGSQMDTQAARNTTSLYTGIETFPMLPRQLSEGATSLHPNEDRAAVVVSFVIDQIGNARDVEIRRAHVRNRAKLIYEKVGAWLDDQENHQSSTRIAEIETIDGLREQVLLQHEAAIRLQKARHQSGALELQTREATPVMKDGRVVDLREAHKDTARKIIELFMTNANMATANWLRERGRSSLGRVVREPERWPRIREIARELGDDLPPQADARALSQFLERQQNHAPDDYAELSLSIVKLLGPGFYEVVRPQDTAIHFGLAAAHYTHSTAPNRRFPDLVVQRIVKATLQNAPAPYSDEELAQIAIRCNEQESKAQKVERTMRKVAAASLFSDRVGQTFKAVVTGASSKGVWVRTFSPPVEGRVVEGERGLDVGQRVFVKLVHTDIERGFIDFVRVS